MSARCTHLLWTDLVELRDRVHQRRPAGLGEHPRGRGASEPYLPLPRVGVSMVSPPGRLPLDGTLSLPLLLRLLDFGPGIA